MKTNLMGVVVGVALAIAATTASACTRDMPAGTQQLVPSRVDHVDRQYALRHRFDRGCRHAAAPHAISAAAVHAHAAAGLPRTYLVLGFHQETTLLHSNMLHGFVVADIDALALCRLRLAHE